MKDKKKGNNLSVFIFFTGIVFVIILLSLVIASVLIKDKSFSEEENRNLQTVPTFSVDKALSGRFESEAESYANDQFPFRNFFVTTKTTFDVLTGKSQANGVYLGKHDYLLEQFKVPSEKENERRKQAISEFSKSHTDLKQYMMIVPNSENILKEYLPNNAQAVDQNKYIEDFYSQTKSFGIQNIDVTKTFNENKSENLFYKTDHHWTSEGAYLAFLEAAKTMGISANINYEKKVVANDFKGTLSSKSGFRQNVSDSITVFFAEENSPKSVINYLDEQRKTATFYESVNLDRKDKYTVFLNGNHPQIKITTPTKENRKLLVIKDSYANAFIPFLAPYFREIVVIDPRYFYGDLEELIKEEKLTEVLFLYNANTFFEDSALSNMLLAR
ncbi:MAG: DHHW family protein [Clostridia bacterium]